MSATIGQTGTPLSPTLSASEDHVFPTLTPEQIARVATHGRARPVRSGEVLVAAGERPPSFFVVTRGSIEVVRSSANGDELFRVLKPGQFTGETNMFSGRQGLVTLRVGESGSVIDVKRDDFLAILQSDSELSDIFMRAFILRRVELVARGFGSAVLIGSNFCQATLRVKEFLTRNGHPYTFVDLDTDSGVQDLLDRFQVEPERCAGAHLPRADRASEPEQRGDRRLPGFQRRDRLASAFATFSSSERGRPASRRRSTGPQKASTCWCSNPRRPADRRGRARKSRITSGFPRASRARSWRIEP